MRHQPIDPGLFIENRRRLCGQLAPQSLAVVNANDLQPANADATLPMEPNSDLFYLTGIEQEESILLLAPDAADPKMREVLFVREPNALLKYATVQYRMGQIDEARKLINRYSKVTEPNAEGLWLAVRIERKVGDKPSEASYANQLRRRFPGSNEYQQMQRGEYD